MELCDDARWAETDNEQARAISALYPGETVYFVSDGRGEKTNLKETKTHTFKFSDNPELILKNAEICRVCALRGIPVPKITPREYGGLFFEEYPRIDGINLYQAIQQGIGAKQIQEIYRDIIKCFAKMDKVSPSQLYKNPINHVHNVARITTAKNNNPFIANLIGAAVYAMNAGKYSDKAFYHTNISPKNIIVSRDGNFVALVDADEIAIADRNYAFGAMAAKYQEIGMNMNDLFNTYYQVGDYQLNKSRVQMMANTNALGQKLLWMHKQSKTK